jgi:hypothetical protein
MKKVTGFNTTFLFVLLILIIPVSVMSAEVYTHAKTGIIFPNEIADHKFIGKEAFDEKGLGEAVSFGHDHATATVYIYDYNRNDIQDDSENRLIMEEISNTIIALQKLQEMGTNNDVKIGQDGRMFGKNGEFVFISVPVTYNSIENSERAEKTPPQTIDSLISIGIYRNHFIKIRYSFPRKEQDDLKKIYKQRDEFINDIRKLVLDVDFRGQMKMVIEKYLKDPSNEDVKKALKVVVAYAKMSPLIEIRIGEDILSLLNVNEYPYWKDLFDSYIIGQTYYQLSNSHFENNHKAGLEQVLFDYKLLKNKDEKTILQSLEEQLKSSN